MHEHGVIHRDLNPTNVFLADDKTNLVKLLDFNVSKIMDIKSSSSHVDGESPKREHKTFDTGKFKYSMFTKTGTPIYTAPELHSSYRYS